jgi:arginine exporter protein ArgO
VNLASAAVTEALTAGILAGYGVALPVGAIATLVVSLSARTRLAVGACAALGVATADGVYAVAACVGGAALARVLAPFDTPLRWCAALVLVGLAIRTAVTAWQHHQAGAAAAPVTGLATPIRAYLGLLGLTLLNPATIVYFSALVVGGHATLAAPDPSPALAAHAVAAAAGSAAAGSARAGTAGIMIAALFVLGAFCASASWQLLLAGGGSVVGRVLTEARGRLATAGVSSVVIVVLAVVLVWPS